jgi:hypothetical protein
MTITETRPAARTRKAAGIWPLVMAVRGWWRTRRYHPVVIDVTDDYRLLRQVRQVRIGPAPDHCAELVDCQRPDDYDEDMIFHTTHAVLMAVDDDVCDWDIRSVANPDLGEDWKHMDDWDWLSPLAYIN